MSSLLLRCGSRTGVDVSEGPPPPPQCVLSADCDGFDDRCQPIACTDGECRPLAPVDCDDHDPCTTDQCEPATGTCLHSPATLDVDGDGFRGPLPGTRAGDPGSCGNDCDDTDPTVYPGAPEVCGRDNDCDGVIDPFALAPTGDALQISSVTEAHPASLRSGARPGFMTSYSGNVTAHAAVYLAPLSESGAAQDPQVQFTQAAADGFGGPLAWTGDRFGLAWSDRRDALGDVINYEIYFNLANPDGSKRLADVRVTHADGFSIDPSLAWTGTEFVVVWTDDGMNQLGRDEIFGQRIGLDGSLIGGNIKLINDGGEQTSPAIAVGMQSLGVVWMRGDATTHQVVFAPFDRDLHPIAPPATLTTNGTSGVYPVIVHDGAGYVIAWHDPDSTVKTAYGAIRDELGNEIVATRPLVQTPGHARYPALLPYGDRLLLVWSDDRDNNFGYELYMRMLDRSLNAVTPEVRLTTAAGNSVDPFLASSVGGNAGLLFGDDRTGSPQVYFLPLVCTPGSTR